MAESKTANPNTHPETFYDADRINAIIAFTLRQAKILKFFTYPCSIYQLLDLFHTTPGRYHIGTSLPEIQKAAPIAYGKRIKRAGTLNAFHDKAFVDAVKNINRPNLVMAGLLTDVCLFHSVASALEAGYNVHVVADARWN